MSEARHSLMLLSNAYKPDPRVQREGYGLVERGYRVTVLCWDRQGELDPNDNDQGVEIRRVQDIHSAYGRGWRQMRHVPRFWRRCAQFASQLRPDFIHCHDLDTLYAGWRIKRLLNRPLIYDAHEHYPAMMSLYLPSVLTKGLSIWERWLIGKCDAILTASTVLKDDYEAAGQKDVVTLGNYPRLSYFEHVDRELVENEHQRLATANSALTVGYVGGFTRNRLFEPFLAAAELRPDVQFHLWGDGHQRRLIEDAAAKRENITYHGWLDYARLPIVFKALDIVYYGLRQDYPGARYNAPNTLAQAMAAGRPVVATDVGDLGRMIRESDCGLLLHEASPTAVADAVDELADPAVRQQLGDNGLRAARERYNATAMQNDLAMVYERLGTKD